MPTGDYYGGHRPGNNLFGESLVAVDLQTGSASGTTSSCTTASGTWTSRARRFSPTSPSTAGAIKAVAQPTKQAFLYVFDRVTGEPVWPIEERPVPKGDVPGEWYSPTQPFPTKPPAYDRQGLSIDDLIDFTPELRAEAVKLVVAATSSARSSRRRSSASAEGPLATLTMAAQAAATNWPGGSFDPETQHPATSHSQTPVATLGLVPPPTGDAVRRAAIIQGNALIRAPRPHWRCRRGAAAHRRRRRRRRQRRRAGLTVQGLPLVKPPYGRITRDRSRQGRDLWQVAHGETPDNIRIIRR